MGDDSRPLTIPTSAGFTLDGVLHPADDPVAAAVVTHPHPLMGGDMHNPVPHGVARRLAEGGVIALRFDFRGTGASGGTHDEGRGEQDDIRWALTALADEVPGVPLVGVGYSFGADVLLAVADERLAAVVAVAPPLRVQPADVLAAPRGQHPTLVLAAAHDQFCPPEQARDVAGDWADTTVEAIDGADHFLSGAVAGVADRALAHITTAVSP